MSYYNQQQPPVGVPPPQGYPPPGEYGKEAYPPQGYPPQGYPPQAYPAQGYPPPYAPPQYAQPPPPQQQNSSAGCMERWCVFLSLYIQFIIKKLKIEWVKVLVATQSLRSGLTRSIAVAALPLSVVRPHLF
ncbi:hypothetical protein CR513_42879, partial [Mucuna pruriens]